MNTDRRLYSIDWILFCAAVTISLLGLVTMHSFTVENVFFQRQIIWIAISVCVFLASSRLDYGFIRSTHIVSILYIGVLFLLGLVLVAGAATKGAHNRFSLGIFAVQPADPAKLILVALLAKYFARRHIEIAHFKHIIMSGFYAFVLFVFVFMQPDLGSGIIIVSIWLGSVLVSGISFKHIAVLLVGASLIVLGAWHFGLKPYQKARIMTFIHPLADIRGTGYNAYQSTVAVGSGEATGKGIGYGTQSKLRFLPEYQTDFIFAAYAEEWGFFGALLLFGLFVIVIVRIINISMHGADNFDALFAAGVALYLLAQFTVHVGMNIGLLPITGTTLPFMSYGGSHLLTEYLALGILMGQRRHARATVQALDQTELLGVL